MKEFKLKKKQKIEPGFKTPDHYFENFTENNIQKLTTNEPKVISLFKRKITWMYGVAAIIIVILSVPIFNTYNSPSTTIDKTILEDYLINNNKISNDALAELLDDQDIQKIKINYNIDTTVIEDLLITNSNLEEYIIN